MSGIADITCGIDVPLLFFSKFESEDNMNVLHVEIAAGGSVRVAVPNSNLRPVIVALLGIYSRNMAKCGH